MKLLGLLGGMSWQSTETYYRLINEEVGKRLGGLHSARLLVSSIDFAPLEKMQADGDWQTAAELLVGEALRLQRAGADGIVLCTNTMHNVAEQLESELSIPLLHIADATGLQLQREGFKAVALLGTRFTMEQAFYTDRLINKFGMRVLTPSLEQRKQVHEIIYQELCHGSILDHSRQVYLRVMSDLVEQGAECVILGCTEIGLLVKQQHTVTPLIDTTEVHAQTACEFLLA
jgi:aspartate racemase